MKVTTPIGNYLPLLGGTMAGNLVMGGNRLTGLGKEVNANDSIQYPNRFATGAVLLNSADTERTATAGSPTKIKEFKVGKSGVLSTYFEIMADATPMNATHGRIYIDGVAKGTDQSTALNSYQAYTEDITVVAGEIVQLWVWHPGPDTYYVRNFRIRSAFAGDGAETRMLMD